MTRTALLLTLSPSALLAGCATHGTPAPAIALDPPPETVARAVPVEPEARPVDVVAVPEPLPLPGQLKPLGGAAPPEPGDPAVRITQAIAAARVEPAREGFVNAVQLWPWTQGALYQLYTSPGHVTDIALQPGENLVSVAAGDTVRWIIGDTTSGTGAGTQVHVLVKPTRSDLKTNMLIHTDRRSYQLELTADRSAWMASAAWTYPQDELIARRAASARAETTAPIPDGVAIEQLRFRYRISGDDPSWRPVQAFDDGARVYIQFPAGIAQGEMPPLFVIGAKGEAQIVNYRARSPYYVVDGLFGAAELRLGEHPQQVVRIERNDGRRRARDGR
jgi:type IV secretion system protein VirB9